MDACVMMIVIIGRVGCKT